jgi:hypothetical protein
MLLSIAAHEDLTIFKVDVGSAFIRTPMVDDVKPKWVKLNKLVVKVLQDVSIHALERSWELYKAPSTLGTSEGTLQGA